ncbi:MAG: Beta-lactamase [Bryobacterales bacterium]|jgi:CubicO group peptidase (beta-lactamase class C family)|nr:Beta-lactamase [Bryobacterales bacterium]
MRNVLTLFCCSVLLAAAADGPIDMDHPNPQAVGMREEALANIPIRMNEFVQAGKTAGVVTIVARHGRVASFETAGYSDIEKKVPMRKDTIFRIASLTKPITCAAIMILVDEGRLSLIDPVEKYLPEYRGLKLNPCGSRAGYSCQSVQPSRPINIEQLMAHTSGLPSSAPSGHGGAPRTLAELVAQGAKSELLFEPGSEWNYSNIGIDILGRLVEVISGKPFDAFLRERIFAPLGMDDTFFAVPAEKQNRVATLYTYENGGPKAVAAEWGTGNGRDIPSPAGGLLSTASDLLRFNQMMCNSGTLAGHRILSSAAVHLMTISHTGKLKAGWAPGVGHGYGYEVVNDVTGMYRYNSLGTFVKGGAYRTYEFVDPQKDLVGIILMQRASGGSDTGDEINSFMQISAAAIADGADQ